LLGDNAREPAKEMTLGIDDDNRLETRHRSRPSPSRSGKGKYGTTGF
jgi:hypothetical protein